MTKNMKSKEWAILIAVVLVVAVAASLITANITGNVIIRQGFGSKVQVTNKAEVLDMLNKCEISANVVTSVNSGIFKISDLCKPNMLVSHSQKSCALGFSRVIINGVDELPPYKPPYSTIYGLHNSGLVSCSSEFDTSLLSSYSDASLTIQALCC